MPICAKAKKPRKFSTSSLSGSDTHGELPRHLVFDSKLTTQRGLARLDQMDIPFITLRRRSRKLLEQVYGLPPSAWRTIELDVPTRKYRTPRVYEQTVALAGRRFRQMFIRGSRP